MKNVSNLFKEELNNGNRNFVKSCTITLKDGTVLNITQDNTWQNGFSIDDAVSNDNTFDIGSAMMDAFTLHINNIYDEFSEYDFDQAVISDVRIGLMLSNGTTEYVKRGVYTVDETSYNGSIITLNCLDNMSKFDKDYSISNLSFPNTLLKIVQDACSCCDVGISADIASFDNSSYVVNERPIEDGLTFRKVLTWVAQICGIWFKCNESGQLSQKKLDMTAVDIMSEHYDGGTFNPWTTGDTLDGGSFNPWSTGDSLDGGSFSEMAKYHHIFSLINPEFATDDVVITGIQVKEQIDDEIITYLSGSTGYILSIEENDLIQGGKGQEVANYLSNKFVGLSFRPLTVNCLTDPTIEAGDVAYITDRHNRSYFTIITRTIITPGQYQSVECNAETPQKNSSKRFSAETKVYQEFRKSIQKERTEREKAIENLGKVIGEASGMFSTNVEQPNGSVITYWHDKATLEESKNVIIVTSEAIGFSTDGGKTYPNGIRVDGETITRLLYAEGINADYINTGAILVKDGSGNVLFSVDMDTGGIFIDGSVVRIGSKNATQALNDNLADAKNYSDSKLSSYAETVTKDIQALQTQIDGQIQNHFYDYDPTLNNIPASEWTTEELRQVHEGDLFYNIDTNKAWRFLKIDGAWQWKIVEDTDTVQALAKAQEALNLANTKMSVFITTPKPPYKVGDMWVDGTDILNCTTARAEGASFVSTDWAKLNNYTDDTLAQQALDEARNARALSIVMSNEYQGVPTDSNGNYSSFPLVTTQVTTYFGHTDISSACTYSVSTSSGITGTWNASTRTYTVTALTADTAYVDITARYLSTFTVTKRFTVVKVKAGVAGAKGDKGDTGATGPAGVGVKAITNYYLATNSASGVTTSTSGWTTTVQSVSSSKKYLWNYEVVTYTNNTTTSTTPTIIGAYGNTGSAGATGATGNGIASISEHYARSTSNSTAPTSWQTTVPTLTTTYKYLWNYEVITYTNGTSVETAKRVIGVYGDTGAQGPQGTAGRTYTLTPNSMTLKKGADNKLTPENVTFFFYYRDGTSPASNNYYGHYRIFESTDGSSFVQKAQSTTTTPSVAWTPTSDNVVLIRCILYSDAAHSNVLDVQTVSILIDIENLTHEQVFNLLTKNGTLQGIYMEGGNLYVNASYIKSGEINGNLIKASSITATAIAAKAITTALINSGAVTAEKISVEDLYSLGAKIGGWGISESTIYTSSNANVSSMVIRSGGNSEDSYILFRHRENGTLIGDIKISGSRGIRSIKGESSLYLTRDVNVETDAIFTDGNSHQLGATTFNGPVIVNSSFKVAAGFTKSILAQTENYGTQAFYCYESPTPMLGDIGEGKIADDGLCYVELDDIFRESVNTNVTYYVFLQKEGNGDCWVKERQESYFVVEGTPGMKFAYEIKAKQHNMEHMRFNDEINDRNYGFSEPDYEEIYDTELEELIEVMGGI